MTDQACLFCKIVAGDIPARVVEKDEWTIAFLDVHPRAFGHIVVIPKHHSETLVGLPDREVAPLFMMVKRMSARALKAFGADGLTIGVNHGAVSGQAVPHLHVHVIPRFVGDGGGSIHSVVQDPGTIDLEEVAKKLGMP
jgi:histidine triad (HIT) family protein